MEPEAQDELLNDVAAPIASPEGSRPAGRQWKGRRVKLSDDGPEPVSGGRGGASRASGGRRRTRRRRPAQQLVGTGLAVLGLLTAGTGAFADDALDFVDAYRGATQDIEIVASDPVEPAPLGTIGTRLGDPVNKYSPAALDGRIAAAEVARKKAAALAKRQAALAEKRQLRARQLARQADRQRVAQLRRAAAAAAQAEQNSPAVPTTSPTGTPGPVLPPESTDGPLGQISATPSSTKVGPTRFAVANIPNRTSDAGWSSSMRALLRNSPDFVTLNEVSRHSTDNIRATAPGYGVHRAASPDRSLGGSQSMNNAILYRSDTWSVQDSGMVKVVDDDRGYLGGKAFIWDRYAVWAVFKRADGAVISVISTHMPINPEKAPRQHGNPPKSRVEMYADGMDVLGAMTAQLSEYGPVILGGDMNSHADQGGWAAGPKMVARGFDYIKDTGVMYLFFRNAEVLGRDQFRISSDHPALTAYLDLP